MAASLNEDSTPSQSTYSSGLVYPTEANRAQGLTMSGISVPGGGSLYAACWVTEGGRINSVNWRVNQGWITLGGTSVASPLVTSIFAVTGNVGATPSFSYSNPSDFFDVTSGSNGSCGSYLCNAGPGYDGPTGNGTPNGALML